MTPAPRAPSAADASVRLAWADDAAAIAEVQVGSLRTQFATLLGDAAPTDSDREAFAQVWQRSLATPPSARHRVLVALQGPDVVGFAATGPGEDPDAAPDVGELLALHVGPSWTGIGHGSRLISAVADTMRADGFTTALTWLMAADTATARFLASAGWSADGGSRDVAADETGQHVLPQRRWHTDLRL